MKFRRHPFKQKSLHLSPSLSRARSLVSSEMEGTEPNLSTTTANTDGILSSSTSPNPRHSSDEPPPSASPPFVPGHPSDALPPSGSPPFVPGHHSGIARWRRGRPRLHASGSTSGPRRRTSGPRRRASGAAASPSLPLSPFASTSSSEEPLIYSFGHVGQGFKHHFILGNAGQGFMHHFITVAAGEDVAQKIMSFVQETMCAVCILSASGSISLATLLQPAALGGTVTYEGCFELLSLSGSYLRTKTGGILSRTGGLSVSLAGTDGCVIGGGVGGPLQAARPVQVIAGSFVIDKNKDFSSSVTTKACGLDIGTTKLPLIFRSPDSSAGISGSGNDDHHDIMGFSVQSRAMDGTERTDQLLGGYQSQDQSEDDDD